MGGAREIVVAGAGLVGSLLATYLRRHGFDVGVYERGPDIRSGAGAEGRSINLVLTLRGLEALRAVGLADGALELTVPVMGRMMHSVDGDLAYQPYGKDDSECNYSISRKGLNRFLVTEAESRGARFRFEMPLTSADLDAGRLELGNETVDAALVFGADGAASALRRAMMRLEGYTESIELLSHGYKELLIPVEQGRRIEKHALHIWPRGDVMLMALPNLDGSFTVTLYLPYRGPRSFGRLDSPQRVLAFFEEHFTDAIPLIPDLTSSYFDNPTGELGTVRCAPWHYRDRAALVGDAAHAIVPFFGQGMNCGFEDCAILDGLLESHGDDWATILPAYTDERKPNGDAIAAMALDNFVEMSERVGDAAFLLRKKVEHALEQRIPAEYRSRYSMVMYSSIPYRVAQEAGRIQDTILAELCDGLQGVEDLDIERARTLIRDKLTPYLEREGTDLSYGLQSDGS
jgi:kynurenine 3-monooxygenase